MSKSLKEKSSDNLIKLGVNIISELSDRGVDFFQEVVNTYNKLKKNTKKIGKIIKNTKEKTED